MRATPITMGGPDAEWCAMGTESVSLGWGSHASLGDSVGRGDISGPASGGLGDRESGHLWAIARGSSPPRGRCPRPDGEYGVSRDRDPLRDNKWVDAGLLRALSGKSVT